MAAFMPLTLLIGALLASILLPIVGGGGRLWWLPVFVWPVLIILFLFDRRIRGRPPHDSPR